MGWRMQVKVAVPVHNEVGRAVDVDWEWRDVRPTDGDPYEYETEDEALRTLQMCYPDALLGFDVRCRQVDILDGM